MTASRALLLPALAMLMAAGAWAAWRGSEVAAFEGESFFDYGFELAVPVDGSWDYVSIRLYAAADANGDNAATMAEGKAAMLARFPGAVVVEPAEVTAQYRVFGTRWPQPATSWVYNPAGSTPAMPPDAAFEAIRLGAEGWDNAGGSGWHFDFLGETTTATGCDGNTSVYTKDGANTVGWGHIVGGHLGYSCHWRGPSLVPGTPYFAIEEMDIIFEPLEDYSAQTLRALALHEFGHSLGLDHTEPTACPGKAMCAGGAASQFITPQQDDIFGVVALYGVAVVSTPTPTPPDVPPGPRPHRAYGPQLARD